MKTMQRIFWLTLLASSLLTTLALARPVYLKGGGVVQAQKVWQEDGKVYALLNRDSLIYFHPDEVNLQKTFAPRPRTKPAAAKVAPAAVAAPAIAPQPAPVAAAPVKPTPAATVKPAATATTAPPADKAPTPAVAAPAASKAAAPAAAAKPAAPPPAPPATAAPAVAKPAGPPAASGAPAQPTVTPAKPAPAPAAAPAPPAAPKKPQAAASKPAKPAKPAAAKQPAAPPAQGGTGLALGFAVAVLLVVLVVLAGIWKVFVKAGEAGWKSLVPIYNLLVMLKIAGCPTWWLLPIFIPVVNLYFIVMLHLRLAEKFGQSHLFGFGLCLLGFVFFPILGFGPALYQSSSETFTFDEEWGDAEQEPTDQAPDKTANEP